MKHAHHHRFSAFCWRCWWVTATFPIEHFVWEKAPVFVNVTRFLGL